MVESSLGSSKGKYKRPVEAVNQGGLIWVGFRQGGYPRAVDLVLETGLDYSLKSQILASKSG